MTKHLLLVLLLAAAAHGADWPQFRGPNRDDISKSKGLLKTWPAAGPTLLWKGVGVGGGYSSLAIQGERIYTLGNKGNLTHFHALDRKTGKLLWSVEVGRSGGSLGCTPTVDDGLAFAIGQEGDLVAIDLKEKKAVWRKNFIKDYGGKYGGWHYCESPLIDGDALICTPGGTDAIMVAFDKKTGKELWTTPSPFDSATAGYSSPVISTAGGVRQYVQLAGGGVLGVNAKTGKVLWTYDKFKNNTANIPTPIILADRVFTSTGYGRGGSLLQLSGAGEGVKAEEVYHTRDVGNKHGGVLVVGNRVFGDSDDSGMPFCANVDTGKLIWKRRSGVGRGSGSASVTYADGHLYFLYSNGVMSLVPANAKGYEERGSFKVPGIGEPAWAHPVVLDGKLYLRGNNVVFCYNLMPRRGR